MGELQFITQLQVCWLSCDEVLKQRGEAGVTFCLGAALVCWAHVLGGMQRGTLMSLN